MWPSESLYFCFLLLNNLNIRSSLRWRGHAEAHRGVDEPTNALDSVQAVFNNLCRLPLERLQAAKLRLNSEQFWAFLLRNWAKLAADRPDLDCRLPVGPPTLFDNDSRQCRAHQHGHGGVSATPRVIFSLQRLSAMKDLDSESQVKRARSQTA